MLDFGSRSPQPVGIVVSVLYNITWEILIDLKEDRLSYVQENRKEEMYQFGA